MVLVCQSYKDRLKFLEDVRNLYRTTYVGKRLQSSNLQVFGRANPLMLLSSWTPGLLDSHLLE